MGIAQSIQLIRTINETFQYIAEQDEERLHRRSMVRLGVRVIHKVPAEAKLFQIPNNSNSTILPRTLRLRLSPKALKLANKFTTASTANNVEDSEPQVNQDNLGATSRIDVGGAFQRCGESKVSRFLLSFCWYYVIISFLNSKNIFINKVNGDNLKLIYSNIHKLISS